MTDRYTFTVTMDADADPMAWKPAEIRAKLVELVEPWFGHMNVDVDKFTITSAPSAAELLAPYMATQHDGGDAA